MSRFILGKDYIPAKLVEGQSRWYIEYSYLDGKKGMVRERPTYNLNRIKDINERRAEADRIVNELNRHKLPKGFPKIDIQDLHNMFLDEAVKQGFEINCRNARKKTKSSYRSVVNHFLNYIRIKKLDKKPIHKFGVFEAVAYLDETQIEKKLAPRTYNSYRIRLMAIFNVLKKKEIITSNPWEKTEKMKPQDANRRRFSEAESKAVFNFVWEHDQMMTLSIILLYFCFIRPGEQRDLKVNNIDLKRGIITVPGNISKNKETEHVTIPKKVIPLLLAIGVHKWDPNNYIFGEGIKPHPKKRCGSNSMRERHNSILRRMQKKGLIRDITGLQFYSWKDSGAMMMVDHDINIYDVMRQLRHKELSTTQIYLKQLGEVSEKIRDLDFKLLDQNIPNPPIPSEGGKNTGSSFSESK